MLKAFDIFPKFSDRNARVHTFSGGLITIIISAWIVFLISGEIKSFLQTHIESSIVIDSDPIQGPRKVYIDFDILINSSCVNLHVDLFEDDGTVKADIIENITRTRLDYTGTLIETAMERRFKSGNYNKDVKYPEGYCGSCYAATEKGQCCNSCSDVMNAYKRKGMSFLGADRWDQCVKEGFIDFGNEKCRIKGSLKIRRGTGKFHIGLGANSLTSGKGHLHDLSTIGNSSSLNHTIKYFGIGQPLPDFQSPLDNIEVQLPITEKGHWLVSYFLHIVPSRWVTKKKAIDSYRYSAMFSQRTVSKGSNKGLPGIHFYYDFQPMKVITTKSKTNIRTLLTHIGGIIGGAFSFAAIVDALMFSALSTIEGKRNIGKDV
ncbi:Endoplasmic reticulum-Golgi intermediate compartment protein 3 [Tritrichomonas foetus]|uniref:Endoplasmic reticulum-Golgi intermediate compartment protein 3 n=1 Tax=Tritrichomonas foetus TaxID=1144522 RepID=A0A1J4K3V6_9EUKA|nr:Endoplasmic reticulum-Golgi intermediate compartment protein 3 [Tritrichomonas foetus]|eukprot:OHT05520.1 Endoplasmic reticulum-Golgi intermediate compartment protein 3 [Tritrichomonas foetus]